MRAFFNGAHTLDNNKYYIINELGNSTHVMFMPGKPELLLCEWGLLVKVVDWISEVLSLVWLVMKHSLRIS